MKNLGKILNINILLGVIVLCFTACGDAPDAPLEDEMETGENVIENTSTFKQDKIERDVITTALNKRNTDWYVYNYLSTDEVSVTAAPAEKSDTTKTIVLEEPVYSVSLTNRPPIFTVDCLEAEDSEACSNQALKKYIQANLVYPKTIVSEEQEGYEMVTFSINEKGEVLSSIFVESKEKPCEPCAKAAVKVVSQMKDWAPALKNGEAVTVEVTLPIKFEVK